MTDKEKAKAYDEALKCAKMYYKENKDYNAGFLPIIFPQLAESEDERIRKVIHKILIAVKKEVFTAQDEIVTRDKAIEWLEKQKEQKVDIDKLRRDLYQSGYNDGYQHGKEDAQKEPHYTKRNALFDKCVENCDPNVMREVSDEIDEMLEKEQKLEPVFKVGDNIKLKSEPKYPYREIIDIKNGAYYFDEAVYLPFDNQDNWEKEQKPAEWSEEDEEMIMKIISSLHGYICTFGSDPKNHEAYIQKEIDWLKSLRPDSYKNCNSRWKPSEEQMEALKAAMETYDGFEEYDAMKSLYEDLKKLM